ncbi:MAG TPA: hypothetical protein VNO30_03185 [Kofleriaceae bacterium]|nr:hypothetical protein [Kofleriaceae bacterium]
MPHEEEPEPPRQRAPRLSETAAFDRVLRAVTIAVVLALGVAGVAMPYSVLRGGTAWLAFLFCVLSGWGYIVVRLRQVPDPDFGLRAAWGAAGYLAVAGVLIAAGLFARPQILALAGIGAIGFAWRELLSPAPSWHRVRDGLRYARARPTLAALVGALTLLALYQMIGGVAALDRNPWDDDLAYTPLVKRLLDTGDLVEPFSFRRMGAYGGQTALGALAAARGTLANVHLIDKALCFGLALLLVTGMARERRVPPIWTALLALVLLLLPDTSINTGAHWTGVALFLALYRTTLRDRWSLVGLVGAATCTLRQNYIAVAVLFIALVLAQRLLAARRELPWRQAVSRERVRWMRAAGVGLLAIASWWLAAYLSNGTFLFPYAGGTWNHELSLRPSGMTWARELLYLAWAAIETSPIVVMPILFALLACTAEDRPGRPLRALLVAAALGFVALVHSFAGLDPLHLWRYAFGFAVALTAIFVIEIGAEHERAARLPVIGRWLLLAALALQLLVERGAVPKRLVALSRDLREAAALDRTGDPAARREAVRHAAMQARIPPGARAAVLLDDPAFLDFRRNRIGNLDTPGFASPETSGGQLPAFRGAEELREYLVAAGYPYVAFVRTDRSRYFHRRPFWIWRLFNDGELYAIMSAYELDMIDSLAELATTTKVLYDDDGLVALDLTAPLGPASRRAAGGSEPARRDAWVKELAAREGLADAWSLTSRHDLLFDDGVEDLEFVDPRLEVARWFEVGPGRPAPPRAPDADPAGALRAMRGKAIRALNRRVHLRVRGETDMRLALRAQMALGKVYTRPRMDVALDGALVASILPDPGGAYALELPLSAAQLAGGWHDLYLVFSSIDDPVRGSREPRTAVLESVTWEPAAAPAAAPPAAAPPSPPSSPSPPASP